ncbi:MspA family porin [Gordonia sp. FQ]|uniref:MspA family porin n=1 Tax=Gordonia sp. FQ TaxID=3446634 RepID=UPI003F842B6A
MSIRLAGESYSIRRAVTNVPTSREIVVSGKVLVTTSGSVKGASVTEGYLVGCQLNFGAAAGATGGLGQDWDVTGGTVGDSSQKANSKAGFALGPGSARFVPVVRQEINDTVVTSVYFTGDRGGLVYSQERFGVNGCVGFAQARALVNVRFAADGNLGNATLYGAPFSIG